jgi:fucose 4-O-acetylase-like acetyltransferase
MEIQLSTPVAAGQVIAADKPATRSGAMRLIFIDNLRWVMIMLVLSMHAAVTYSGVGSWYYNEPVVPGRPALFAFITYQTLLQSFFMGLLFFVAGYFVPGAFDKKGAGRFLKDRAYRLGLPTLLYIFILGPLTEYYVSKSWAGDSPDRSFLREYDHYIMRGRWPGGTGPLWFCAALLVFCAGYAVWRSLSGRTDSRDGGPRPFPGKLVVGGFILVIALASFGVRIFWPNGTSFYNMQFCYFSQYILFFIAGTLAYRRSWLTTLPRQTGVFWRRVALIGGGLLWIALLIFGGAFKGHAPDYRGGIHWQSLGLCLFESVAGVGLSLYCLVLFRDRYNRQGRLARFFSDNAFAVYVFHPPVLIAISLGMAGLHWPPLLKFVLLTVASIIVTYSISGAILRKIPLLKKIL